MLEQLRELRKALYLGSEFTLQDMKWDQSEEETHRAKSGRDPSAELGGGSSLRTTALAG